jgi:integrase
MNTLKNAVADYLALRRGLGFKLRLAGPALLDFVSFLEREGASHITCELAVRWAMQRDCQPATSAARLGFVRGFARHWSATDSQTEIPAYGLLSYRPARARPYLYTNIEIERLMAVARDLPPATGLRRWTYHCLFGLLAVTGLRISEAIALERKDVDLQQSMLVIRSSKFGKSRLVPFVPSTGHALVRYAKQRDRLLPQLTTQRFLVNDCGRPLESSNVRRTFYRLSRRVGLRGPDASHGPRLHDFRHRFAVDTLIRWYRAGEDVERRLPILSTYLGHAHVTDTYWYLSACPELMGLATQRLERRWEDWP